MNVDQEARKLVDTLLEEGRRQGREEAEKIFKDKLQKTFGGGFTFEAATGAVSDVDATMRAREEVAKQVRKGRRRVATKEEQPKKRRKSKAFVAAYTQNLAKGRKVLAAKRAAEAKKTRGRNKKK